jgi:hypothetical protein
MKPQNRYQYVGFPKFRDKHFLYIKQTALGHATDVSGDPRKESYDSCPHI